jgi:hypothetical protein
MKGLKKIVIFSTIIGALGLSGQKCDAWFWNGGGYGYDGANVQMTNAGGCGYAECCRAPSVIPAIALGTIALVAIVAVAVQNQGHGNHGH